MKAEIIDGDSLKKCGVAKKTDAVVITDRALPLGAYPHYRRAGDFVFVSGTSSRRKDGTFEGAVVDASGKAELDIKAQTRAVLRNIGEILAHAGLSLSDVVEMGCFLVNMDDFKGFNEVWSEFFGDSGPTRTTVAVHQLPHPLLLVEMKAVAFAPEWERAE